MTQIDHNGTLKILQRAFASPISWMKASSTCRYKFEVQGVGEFRPEFHVTAHSHSYYEIGLGLNGTGELEMARNRESLCPGSLFVIEPGMIHRLASAGSEQFWVFSFHVSPESLAAGKADSIPGIELSKVMENKELLNILVAWASVNRDLPNDHVALSLFARYLAFEMLFVLSERKGFGSDSLVERAKKAIENTLPGKLVAPDLAASLGVSERTLRRHFKEHLGKSVTDYVNDQRLLMAERSLAHHISVSDTARLVGFESPSQLTRLFQKSKGVTPKSWQQSIASTRRIPISKSVN